MTNIQFPSTQHSFDLFDTTNSIQITHISYEQKDWMNFYYGFIAMYVDLLTLIQLLLSPFCRFMSTTCFFLSIYSSHSLCPYGNQIMTTNISASGKVIKKYSEKCAIGRGKKLIITFIYLRFTQLTRKSPHLFIDRIWVILCNSVFLSD